MVTLCNNLSIQKKEEATHLGKKEFLSFLDRNGIDQTWYANQRAAAEQLPAYFRFYPGVLQTATEKYKVHSVEDWGTFMNEKSTSGSDAFCKLKWLEDIHYLQAGSRLSDSKLIGKLYEAGLVYGIDAASAYTVQVLDPQPQDIVLDMCCAPGAKLCYIADRMKRQGVLVGIDQAEHRVNACANILRKYNICSSLAYPVEIYSSGTGGKNTDSIQHPKWTVQLICTDATSYLANGSQAAGIATEGRPATKLIWSTVHEKQARENSKVYDARLGAARKSYKRKKSSTASTNSNSPPFLHLAAGLRVGKKHVTKSTAKMLERHLEKLEAEHSIELILPTAYNKILVDAECSTDGSFSHLSSSHIRKKESQWQTCAEKEQQLETLQRSLIRRAFELLAPGGMLVYSTCSFCRRQNEDIIAWLLSTVNSFSNGDGPQIQAKLLPLDECMIPARIPFVNSTVLKGTLRFEPVKSKTSGLFIAKVTKSVRE